MASFYFAFFRMELRAARVEREVLQAPRLGDLIRNRLREFEETDKTFCCLGKEKVFITCRYSASPDSNASCSSFPRQEAKAPRQERKSSRRRHQMAKKKSLFLNACEVIFIYGEENVPFPYLGLGAMSMKLSLKNVPFQLLPETSQIRNLR